MTGEKNRFKTTEKLWNLDDKQLKSPNHDAMVLWLMDFENLYGELEFFKFVPENYGSREISNEKIKSEFPIMSSPTFIAGYADIALFIEYGRGYKSDIHIIEVKPYVDSFGAVLRQINSYEKFLEESRNYKAVYMYLFTLDTRFDNHFKNQGIHVLHPPEDISIDDMRRMYGL